MSKTPKIIIALAVSLLAAACSSTNSLSTHTSSSVDANRQGTDQLKSNWEASPQDPEAGLKYASSLTGQERYSEASSVLEMTAMRFPNHKKVLAAYGKSLINTGNLQQASLILSNAHDSYSPDWTVLSAQGIISDQLGEHSRAIKFYEAALKISPDNPNIISNIGLSYLLTKDRKNAEKFLKQAADIPNSPQKVKDNYLLVQSIK